MEARNHSTVSPSKIVVLIPAYKPQSVLITVAEGVLAEQDVNLVVVDDGSGPEYEDIFEKLKGNPRIHVIPHAVNLGKGAALKTGMNYALTTFPELVGVVTADADGQHLVDDIKRVADALVSSPDYLILGARSFAQAVPLRNRAGNILTRNLVRLLMGQKLSDTQTGLRGISRTLIREVLRIPSNGYEFELEMLTTAKHRGIKIREVQIRTIYDHPGQVSHFNPLVDSMKIYFVLLRFGFVSLLTAAIDNLVFFLVFQLSSSILVAQVLARSCALVFNYVAARNSVFLSREKHVIIFPKYLTLVVINGFISYALIEALSSWFHFPVIGAKLLAESVLFLANFAIQRDFVFTARASEQSATDWTTYYQSVPSTAKVTRKYTSKVLVSALRRYAGVGINSLAEVGGANSCFLDEIRRAIEPKRIHIIDLNEFGLKLLQERLGPTDEVFLYLQDCRKALLPEQCDAVFSVGLIEHFGPADTREAALAHYRLLRPGGILIISFPTPTLLYRAARGLFELLGVWKFPDERALSRGEVRATIEEEGTVLFEKTLWPLILTQHMIVARKNS
jgi:glycosyltransferase involved in cell wall biosynthesis/SAM-dependent methyltransferase